MLNSIKLVTRQNTPRWVVLIIDLIISAISFSFACILTDVFLKSIDIETDLFVNKVETLMMENELLLPSECRTQLVELVLIRKMRKLVMMPS